MFNQHCLYCQDKKRYEIKLMESRRIMMYLRRIAENTRGTGIELEEKQRIEIERALCGETASVHFMCGHCMAVNTMELNNTITDIKYSVIEIIALIKHLKKMEDNRANKLKYEVLNALQGHFPIMWRAVNKYTAE